MPLAITNTRIPFSAHHPIRQAPYSTQSHQLAGCVGGLGQWRLDRPRLKVSPGHVWHDPTYGGGLDRQPSARPLAVTLPIRMERRPLLVSSRTTHSSSTANDRRGQEGETLSGHTLTVAIGHSPQGTMLRATHCHDTVARSVQPGRQGRHGDMDNNATSRRKTTPKTQTSAGLSSRVSCIMPRQLWVPRDPGPFYPRLSGC